MRVYRFVPAVKAALFLLLGLAPMALVPMAPAFAQSDDRGDPTAPLLVPNAQIIREIRIEGTQRIEPQTVTSYLTVHEGEPFDQPKLDESLKALFATGLFADVTLRQQGSALVIKVVENPIINRIAFEGNKKVETDKLQQELQLRPRVVYTRTRVQADADRIQEIYRRSGRYSARVDPKVIVLDQNRVDLVFEIDEGPRTPVRSINFVGNHAFDDADLRDAIQTRESAWYRFLTSNDTYDPDRLNFDRELLRRFYLSKGYADFRVVSAVAELSPDRTDFFITITVEEGEHYDFGKIDVTADLKGLEVDDELREVVETKDGESYNANEIENSIVKLTNAVEARRYVFVDVRPQVGRNRTAHTIDVTYAISEGPHIFVERIEITGNLRTIDEVVRREILMAEGDAYNTARIKRSEQRVKDLGFFEKAEIQTAQGSEPDKSVLNVLVTEQSTGEISLGAGYSTTDGPLVDFRIRERNLLGEGKDVQLSATVSGLQQEFDLGYTQPYFLNRDLALGIDIFRISRDLEETASYSQTQTGFSIRAGYPLSEKFRQRLSYRFDINKIGDIQDGTSIYIAQQAGTRHTSAVGQELSYDQRDSRLEPTKGYILSLSTDLAGLGGDVRYVRGVATGSIYTALFSNVIWGTTAEAGYIKGLGQKVNIGDRFFLGADTMRGFKLGGIGPRDTATTDALGANHYIRGTSELTFPLGLPSEFGIKAHLFTDAALPGGTDDSGVGVVDKETLRASLGVGVSFKSPLGPIRVDVAYPVLKESFDQTEVFRFSFGTKF